MATIRCREVSFSNIQAILFDKDGTLANSETFLRNLAQRRARLIDAQIPGVQDPLLMAFGINGDRIHPAGLMAVGTRQENEVAAAAYVAETGRDWVESLTIAHSAFTEADKYMQRKADYTPPVEGSQALLQALVKAEVKTAILSSDSTNNVQDFVQRYQLQAYIQKQVGVDGYLSKSDPELVQGIFQALQVAPEHVLVIGDAMTDLQVARAAGTAGCIGYTGGWTTPIQLNEADVSIHSFAEIEIDGGS